MQEIKVFGREQPSDIILPFNDISRHHARIAQIDLENLMVEDLNSKQTV
jgi:pSer/pThr/pTyr-binding forkhead associated (FHA) protein